MNGGEIVNRRQAKKRFVKEYGMTPKEMCDAVCEAFPDLKQACIDMCVGIIHFCNEIVEFVRSDYFQDKIREICNREVDE